MKRPLHRPRIILITDPAFGDDVILRGLRGAADALPRGWLSVQLRDKMRPRVSLRVFAHELRAMTRAVGASLVINGDALLARDVGCDGVHVSGGAPGGAETTGHAVRAAKAIAPGAWISVAAHSDDDVRAAEREGADAVLVSPVFSTRAPSPTAVAKVGRGLDALRSARAIAGAAVSVYALGGVTAERAERCLRAGAHGIAVMRTLFGSAEPARAARALHDAVALHC